MQVFISGTLDKHGPPVVAASAVLLAVSSQFSIIVPIGTGLRMTASDLVMPLVGAVLILAVRPRPGGLVPPLWSLLAAGAATAVIIGGILHGLVRLGEFFPWAMINRGIGWFVLLAYGWTGFILARHASAAIPLFFRWFLLAGGIIAAASICSHIFAISMWPGYNDGHGWARLVAHIASPETGVAFDLVAAQFFRLEGFYENPNAYGLLTALCATILCLARGNDLRLPVPTLILAVLLTATYLSASRSAWLGLAAGIVLIGIMRALPWRRFATAGAAAALFIVVALPASLDFGISVADGDATVTKPFPSQVAHDTSGYSLSHRMELLHGGFEMWQAHPVFGAGIGVFYASELETGGDPAVLHNTAIWLLAETGIVGFLVALAALVVTVRALVSEGVNAPPQYRLPILAGATALIVFAAASIGMDSLYQRHLWLLIGIGIGSIPLARPAKEHAGQASREAAPTAPAGSA